MKISFLLLAAFALVVLTVSVLCRVGRQGRQASAPRQVLSLPSAASIPWRERQAAQLSHWRNTMLRDR
jgi:hypothetical protein